MNNLDKLQENLHQHLEDLEPGSIILTKVSQNKSIWFSVAMLNVLLNRKNMAGVYVSLGKPHFMIQKAMDHNRYDTSDLVYIDTIGHVGTEKIKGKKVVFLDGPYHLEPLLNTISKGFSQGGEVEQIPMDVVNFFYMDNLEEILVYNDTTKIVHFLKNFKNLMKRYQKIGMITFYRMENPVVKVFTEDADWVFEAQEDWF